MLVLKISTIIGINVSGLAGRILVLYLSSQKS